MAPGGGCLWGSRPIREPRSTGVVAPRISISGRPTRRPNNRAPCGARSRDGASYRRNSKRLRREGVDYGKGRLPVRRSGLIHHYGVVRTVGRYAIRDRRIPLYPRNTTHVSSNARIRAPGRCDVLISHYLMEFVSSQLRGRSLYASSRWNISRNKGDLSGFPPHRIDCAFFMSAGCNLPYDFTAWPHSYTISRCAECAAAAIAKRPEPTPCAKTGMDETPRPREAAAGGAACRIHAVDDVGAAKLVLFAKDRTRFSKLVNINDGPLRPGDQIG